MSSGSKIPANVPDLCVRDTHPCRIENVSAGRRLLAARMGHPHHGSVCKSKGGPPVTTVLQVTGAALDIDLAGAFFF